MLKHALENVLRAYFLPNNNKARPLTMIVLYILLIGVMYDDDKITFYDNIKLTFIQIFLLV